jgi:hypothetical protein
MGTKLLSIRVEGPLECSGRGNEVRPWGSFKRNGSLKGPYGHEVVLTFSDSHPTQARNDSLIFLSLGRGQGQYVASRDFDVMGRAGQTIQLQQYLKILRRAGGRQTA